jgi:division protein CdvB (Snf7/Vps24/ESCRT-III family)
MSKDMYIDESELKKLGRSFETHAYDLQQYLKDFKKATDAETIHDGFGVLTESEDVTSAYIELAENMANALEELHRHFDSIGSGMRDNAKNSDAADDAMAEMFKGDSR